MKDPSERFSRLYTTNVATSVSGSSPKGNDSEQSEYNRDRKKWRISTASADWLVAARHSDHDADLDDVKTRVDGESPLTSVASRTVQKCVSEINLDQNLATCMTRLTSRSQDLRRSTDGGRFVQGAGGGDEALEPWGRGRGVGPIVK